MDKKELLAEIAQARGALVAAAGRIPPRIIDAPLTETRRWKRAHDVAVADYHFKHDPSPNNSVRELEAVRNKLKFYLENLQ